MIRPALISLALAVPATAATIGPEPVIEAPCNPEKAPWYCTNPAPLPLLALLGDPWAKRPTMETIDVPTADQAYPPVLWPSGGIAGRSSAARSWSGGFGVGGGGGGFDDAAGAWAVASAWAGSAAHSSARSDLDVRVLVDLDGLLRPVDRPDEPEVIPLPMSALLLLGALAGLGFLRGARR